VRLGNIFTTFLLLATTPTAVDRLAARADPLNDEIAAAVRQAIDDGRYADAERLAIDLDGASDLLIEALTKNGKGGDARTLSAAERVVADQTARFGKDSLQVAASLQNLGALLTERGEFIQAILSLRQALDIRRGMLPAKDPQLPESLDGLALPLIMLERFPQAEEVLAEAIRIRDANPNADFLGRARTLFLQAMLGRRNGSYEAAMTAVDEVLKIRRDRVPNHPETAAALMLKGDLLLFKGDVDGAQQIWTKALTITEKAVGLNHPLTSPLFHRFAVASQELGDLSAKHTWLRRALQSALGPSAPCYYERLTVLNDFGTLSDYLGEFEEARRQFREARTSATRCLGPMHSLTATIIHNEAVLAADMGDFGEADRLQNQAIRIWSSRLGANHPYVARGLDALASVAMMQGQTAEANQLTTRALGLRSRALGASHPDVASTLINLARTNVAGGAITRAREQVERAIAIYRSGDRPQEPDYMAAALEFRGTLNSWRGAYNDARTDFTNALTEREDVFGTNHPLTAQARAKLASAEFALGNADVAVRDALLAEQVGRDHLRFTIRYLPERQAMAYADKRPRGLDLALSVIADGRTAAADDAFDAVVRSRGVVLDELAARAQSAQSIDTELASLNAAVVTARERFANLMLRSLKGEDPVPRAMLDEARERKEAAERALAEKSATARAEAARSNIGLQQVRGMLPDGTALVAFVRYDRTTFSTTAGRTTTRMVPSYIAFVARVGASGIESVPLGSASSIDMAISAWRDQVGGQSLVAGTSPADAERTYRAAGARLRQRIWDPVAGRIRGDSQVFIVPDGAINLVSFAALPTEQSHYLVEDGPTIHYLSTERDLVPLDVPSGRGLLAVGGPAFDERYTAASSVAARRSGCTTLGYVHFEDLPGSRNEASDVTRIWSSIGEQGDARLLSGRTATETAVKQAAAGRRVVHLATHGYFLDSRCDSGPANTRGVGALSSGLVPLSALGENPLLLTGLALAGANVRTSSRGGAGDGILTAEEVAGLNLQGTEWAVLSACDTGAGQIKAGEGVFGLRRAFQIAGARTIIMSLWSVEDQSTRSWMRDLYNARFSRHLTTAAAVRDASLNALKGRRARHQSTHPFYWAGFVAAGDWR
jgi:CHAT domain-containing protein/tetratricopeptide (TPR) repeat protein